MVEHRDNTSKEIDLVTNSNVIREKNLRKTSTLRDAVRDSSANSTKIRDVFSFVLFQGLKAKNNVVLLSCLVRDFDGGDNLTLSIVW